LADYYKININPIIYPNTSFVSHNNNKPVNQLDLGYHSWFAGLSIGDSLPFYSRQGNVFSIVSVVMTRQESMRFMH